MVIFVAIWAQWKYGRGNRRPSSCSSRSIEARIPLESRSLRVGTSIYHEKRAFLGHVSTDTLQRTRKKRRKDNWIYCGALFLISDHTMLIATPRKLQNWPPIRTNFITDSTLDPILVPVGWSFNQTARPARASWKISGCKFADVQTPYQESKEQWQRGGCPAW
jgi:hypothetical protein